MEKAAFIIQRFSTAIQIPTNSHMVLSYITGILLCLIVACTYGDTALKERHYFVQPDDSPLHISIFNSSC